MIEMLKIDKQNLMQKINDRNVRVAVVGLGYVGLPTAALFANKGFSVTGIDVNASLVQKINNCQVDTKEVGLDEIIITAYKNGYFNAVVSPSKMLEEADVVIACVQTPVDSQGDANLTFLKGAIEEIARNLTKSKLIIIQSTVPPKTFETLIVPTLEKISGLRCGATFWLAYCPERLAPGSSLEDLMMNSRLIGAFDDESAILSKVGNRQKA